MVGVAGKSRACHDCKRRRVKCDFQRPACSRCEKANLLCQGYEKPPIFVNQTLANPSTNAVDAISAARLLKTQPISKPPASLSEALHGLRNIIADPSRSPVRFRSQAWELLNGLYLPRGQSTNDSELSTTTPYSWLQASCRLSLESSVLDQSLLAFCANQVYIAEPWSIKAACALELYSRALSTLAHQLGHPQEQSKDETLAAIVVLSTCEFFILQTDEGFRAHAHGISELLRHRNPSEGKSVLWLSLCSRLRIICVIIGLARRKRLALCPNVWRRFMRVDSLSLSADSFEGLMDLISEGPLLLEELDRVIGSGSTCPILHQSLIRLCSKIGAWQHSQKRSSGKAQYWAVPSRLHNPADDGFASKLFPFSMEFESLNVAIQTIFSTSVMLQLLSAALLLENGSDVPYEEPTRQDTNQALTNEPHSVEEYLNSGLSTKDKADRLARFVCQSMEYCFRQDTGTLGMQITCHPQLVTRNYFRRVGLARELEWCKNIKNMDGLGCRQGIKLMLLGSEEDL